MYYGPQSTDFPPNSFAGDINVNDINKLRAVRATNEAYVSMMENYGDLITERERNRAAMMTFGWQNASDYEKSFMIVVLMNAYRVFKNGELYEDQNYLKILERIKGFNPEWEASFIRRHDTRVKIFEEARRKGKTFHSSQ